jgi:DNA polymerase-3 subunit epsilon
MREIVLDTETTGFDPFSGDRIVEIGAVELFNHMPTGETFHVYINPERSMPQEAFGVHGIGPDLLEPPQKPEKGQVTLRDKPVFAQFGQAFLDFVRDSRMVIHNASFDMKFLNAELDWMGLPKLPMEQALDTLAIARKRFPGSPATLDALCRRFQIDNSNRTLHGALLDSEILAEVYLELIGGRQPDFGLSTNASSGGQMVEDWRPAPRPSPLPPRLTKASLGRSRRRTSKNAADFGQRRFCFAVSADYCCGAASA